ncbi:MAG: DUF4276 family protein [Phycisphaerae bacterium]
MRILLVAEGQHEFHGALECLIRRLLPPGTTLTQVEKIKMSDATIGHVSGRGNRLTKRILFAMRHAIQLRCDALVLLIDEDGDRDRRPCILEAQESTAFPIQRAIGIAVQAFDAWMLADETAISVVLRKTIGCQPAPEEITRPKDKFAELLRESGSGLRFHEAYAQIAENARMEILLDRCPSGFAPFAKRISQLRE